MTFANINLDTNFSVLVPCASAKLDLKTTNIFSYTALVIVIIAETSLTVSLILLTEILEIFPQQSFVIYYYLVIPVSPRFIIESTIFFVKSASRFKQIWTNQIALIYKDSVFCSCVSFLFMFTVYYLFLHICNHKGLHIIYWGYGAGNIAYGATTFL